MVDAEREQAKLVQLCKDWKLPYGEEEFEAIIKSRNDPRKVQTIVPSNHRNPEWNMLKVGRLSLTGLRGR